MNNLMYNLYTIFKSSLDMYNKQRSEKIELGYIGQCQNFYIFAGDWQNLFLINDEGGFEIYLKDSEPADVSDISSAMNVEYWTKEERKFNYKYFIKWLYKRNLLVKNINWTNLETIRYLQKCSSKIKPFHGDILIDRISGLHKGTEIGCFNCGGEYFIETYNYEDEPHIILVYKNERYRVYLPPKCPKTQKEMLVKPDFPFKEDYYAKEIKDIKHYTMLRFSEKSESGNHLMFYEFLLLYRSFNPNIQVERIKPNRENRRLKNNSLKYISFCQHIVNKYALAKGLNPYKILAEMYKKGYINHEARINNEKRKYFIKAYSYLCEG